MVQVIKFKGGCAKTYGHLQCNIINSTEKERCNIITKSLRLGKIFSNFFFFYEKESECPTKPKNICKICKYQRGGKEEGGLRICLDYCA